MGIVVVRTHANVWKALAIIPQRCTGDFFAGVFEKSQYNESVPILDYFTARCLSLPEGDADFHVLRNICSKWQTSIWSHDSSIIKEPWIAIEKALVPTPLALNLFRVAVQYECQGLFDSICAGIIDNPDNYFLSQVGVVLDATTLDLESLREP